MGLWGTDPGLNQSELNNLLAKVTLFDLKDFRVVLTLSDIDELPHKPLYGVVAQTTQPKDKVRRLVSEIKERFRSSEVRCHQHGVPAHQTKANFSH